MHIETANSGNLRITVPKNSGWKPGNTVFLKFPSDGIHLFSGSTKNKTWYRFIAYPSLFWFLIFLLLPLAMVFVVSFLTRGTYGGLEWIFQTGTI